MALFVEEDGQPALVFEKRAKEIRQSGEICFPGGAFDPELDSTFLGTAVRETSEELGIPEASVETWGRLPVVIAPMGALVEPFAGFTAIPPAEFHPGADEVEKVFTVPLEYFLNTPPEIYHLILRAFPDSDEENLFPAKELGLPERYHRPWGNAKNKIYVYRTTGGVIWGITARIIRDLVVQFQNSTRIL
jgi:peroxisomal coenzyme A diphosphatase NUDT7